MYENEPFMLAQEYLMLPQTTPKNDKNSLVLVREDLNSLSLVSI